MSTKFGLFLLICILFLFSPVSAVKAADFKKCEQSGFCARNRAYADHSSSNTQHLRPYSVMKNTLKWEKEEGRITADIQNVQNGVLFSLHINFYERSIVRLKILEKSPLKKRYEVQDVLIEDGKSLLGTPFTFKDGRPGSYLIEFGGSKSAYLRLSPFSLDLFNDDVHVVGINKKGWLNYEHYRVKTAEDDPVPVPEGQEAPPENPLTKGSWEETFSNHKDTKKDGPSSIALDVTFIGSSDVFGLPEHATNFSLKTTRGGDGAYTEPYRLYNLDVFEFELDSPMALYGTVPFMISHKVDIQTHKSYSNGFFWLNAAETWVDVTKESSGPHLVNQETGSGSAAGDVSTVSHWISESGVLDFFVILEDSPKDTLRQYAKLTGTQALPPLFSLAYHQCRWNYMDVNEVAEVNQGFEQNDIPMDVIWLDIEHTDQKKYFTWHPTKFQDPLEMQKSIGKYSRKMVTIIDPHIKREEDYHVKKMASEKGLFVKNKDGGEFDGWCWPGSSSWLDFTNPEARQLWAKLFSFDLYKGSSEILFTWNDMNEPSVFTGPEITMPKDNLHWQEWEHRDVHNIYGMYLHRSTYSGHIRRTLPSPEGAPSNWLGRTDTENGPKPQRPFVLSRAFFPGTQRYGAIWTGDNMARWDHLESSAPMLLSISMAGVSFCGVDVGGFFENPTPELITRWYQAGIFYPFFRGHAHLETRKREPWVFGEPYLSYIRSAIVTRYQMLPYWYTLFRHAQVEGVPPMRPLFMEFPFDANLLKEEQQYMIGDTIMVKPIVKPLQEGGTNMDVIMPGSDTWFDFYSNVGYRPGLTVQFTGFTLGNPIPTFIRAGKVLPLRTRVRRSTTAASLDPYTLIVTLDHNGKAGGDWYTDDGESFSFAFKGEFVHQTLDVTLSAKEIRLSSRGFEYKKRSKETKNVMEPWQRPFLGESIYDDNKNLLQDWSTAEKSMHFTPSSSYAQELNNKVSIEKIVILGTTEQLKSWTKPTSIKASTVGQGETSLDLSSFLLEDFKVQGPAIVPTARITIKKPQVGVGLDFDLFIKK